MSKAVAIEPDVATNYVAHTYIGDPAADGLMAELSSFGHGEIRRFLQAGMDRDEEGLKAAPESVREFFDGVTQPAWVDQSAFAPGRQDVS